MITYAQNFEDVMIARLFSADYCGFYVDIGAAHPEYLSVTCHFYKQGWSGINVEPSMRFYPLLCEARPKDTNLNCAIGQKTGRATFYEFTQFAENSTLERDVADKIARTGQPSTTHEVEVMRLVDLCNMYVKERTIDFMKIDVEGGELGVLEGADWGTYRPRLLIVEAAIVNSQEENSATWERILIEANYHKIWFDGLNNFYLRNEDLALRHSFRLPPNLFDRFETAELVAMRGTAASLQQQVMDREAELVALRQTAVSLQQQVLDREAELAALTATAVSLQQQVLDREAELAALTQTTASQQEQLQQLMAQKSAVEAERSGLLSSRSWRMTAPLRALSIRARRVASLLRD
jgi:FkbM family methyltransferase